MSEAQMVLGVDLYHGDDPVDFHALAGAGVEFVFLKATQGEAESDPLYAEFRDRALSVGMLVGAYHFYDPSVGAQGQVEHFLSVAKPSAGDLRPALDVETAPVDGNLTTAVESAAAQMKAATGLHPFLYCSPSFYDQYLAGVTSCPIWSAEYGVSAPRMSCVIWQYSETGLVTGIDQFRDA